MLTEAAFNALLKTLEEPPAHAVFVLATTDVHKVPATITSRCQRFDFRRIPLRSVIDSLKAICAAEEIEVEQAALERVARHARGSLRDAESLLDQLIAFAGDRIDGQTCRQCHGLPDIEKVRAVTEAIHAGDVAAVASGRGPGLVATGRTCARSCPAWSTSFAR